MMPYALFGAGGDEEVECIDFSYYETDSVITEGTKDTIIVHFSIPEGSFGFPEDEQPEVNSFGELDTAYFSNYLVDRKYLIITSSLLSSEILTETNIELVIDYSDNTSCDNDTLSITINIHLSMVHQ